jgi:hypothetical protein
VETNEFKEFRETQKRVSLNKLQNESKIAGSLTNTISGNNNINSYPYRDPQEHINNIKAILSAYIKEKELDV